jgi:hypothetical protein
MASRTARDWTVGIDLHLIRPVLAGNTHSVFCWPLDLLDHVDLHRSFFRLEP